MSEAHIYLDAQIQVRRDTEANWAAVDPVLRDGEMAYSRDINRIKIGDGAHKWSELKYMLSIDLPGYDIQDLSELLAWYDKVGKLLEADDNGLYTGENFRSYKEITAGGIGTESDEEGESGSDTLGGLLDVEIGDMSGMTDAEKESQVVGYDNTKGIWVNKVTMYHHKQTTASMEWTIAHNLGKFPNVKIVDSLKQLCFADVIYEDTNTVLIRFGAAESGDAYLD